MSTCVMQYLHNPQKDHTCVNAGQGYIADPSATKVSAKVHQSTYAQWTRTHHTHTPSSPKGGQDCARGYRREHNKRIIVAKEDHRLFILAVADGAYKNDHTRMRTHKTTPQNFRDGPTCAVLLTEQLDWTSTNFNKAQSSIVMATTAHYETHALQSAEQQKQRRCLNRQKRAIVTERNHHLFILAVGRCKQALENDHTRVKSLILSN